MLYAFEKNDVEEMTEEEKLGLFDDFLAGEMSPSEVDNFKLSLANDPVLQKEFDDYKKWARDIKLGAEYRQIQTKLQFIHEREIKNKKPLILRPRFWIPVAAAAVITVLVMVIPFNQANDTNVAVTAEDYHPLINGEEESDNMMEEAVEMDSSSVEMDIDMADSVSGPLFQELSYVRKDPKGTCFLISSDGYFLTNKHLVPKKKYVRLQQHDLGIAFNAEVVYRDTLIDLAILKCSDKNADLFNSVPFKFFRNEPSIGDEVFTLGYPKSDIVYTKGDVSSETGYQSDSLSYEISMPSNPGNSGAPLFNEKGDLIGMIMANNSRKQSVTYIVKHEYIQQRISDLKDSMDIDMSRNFSKRYSNRSDLIKKYRNFIFEVH